MVILFGLYSMYIKDCYYLLKTCSLLHLYEDEICIPNTIQRFKIMSQKAKIRYFQFGLAFMYQMIHYNIAYYFRKILHWTKTIYISFESSN